MRIRLARELAGRPASMRRPDALREVQLKMKMPCPPIDAGVMRDRQHSRRIVTVRPFRSP
jgi:hypothetical protein